MSTVRWLSEIDQERLLENPYHILRNTKGPAKNKLLQYEPLYVSARTTRNLNEYWRYLEILLGKGDAKKTFATQTRKNSEI